MSCKGRKGRERNGIDERKENQRENKCPRLRKGKQLHSVDGQLSSLSHNLCTSPVGFFLELCTVEKVVHVLVSHSNQLCWERFFSIGQSYRMQRLKLITISVESEKFCVYQTTEESLWERIEDLQNTVCPTLKFSMLRGKVTDVDHDLGIYCLSSRVHVIAGTLVPFAYLPTPKVGDIVDLYNVHRVIEDSGIELAVMCAKSYMKVNNSNSRPYETSSILKIAKKHAWGYRKIYWIYNAYSILRNSFTDDFITSIGVPDGDIDSSKKAILLTLVQHVSSKVPHCDESSKQRSVVLEVLSPQHKCSPMEQEVMPFSLSTVNKLLSTNPMLEETSVDGSKEFWCHSCTRHEDDGVLLVAVLSVKSPAFRLTLKDATGFLYCVLQNNDGEDLLMRDLTALNGNVVLVFQHKLIRERFSFRGEKDKEKKSHDLVYLHTLTEHLHVLVTLSKAGWHAGRADHLDCEGEKVVPLRISEMPDIQTLRKEMVSVQLTRPSNPLEEYWSQLVFVHHKSCVSLRDYGKPPKCLLLVSLLGVMKKISKGLRSTKCSTSAGPEDIDQNMLFLTLQCPNLIAYPLINKNVVHELRLPLTCPENFFSKQEELIDLRALKSCLATTKGVVLPTKTEIYCASCRLFKSVSSNYIDCYTVEEALKGDSHNQFINVIGYVVERFHQEPRFEREKFSVRTHGYGIPESRIVAITLSDTPPGSDSGSPATCYLSWWQTLQYPLGLVPAAKIVVRFVTKIYPKSDSHVKQPYFRTSVLSVIEFLDLPDARKLNQQDNWGPRGIISQLPDASDQVTWGTVAVSQLHTLTIAASCRFCEQLFLNGTCGFVGCSAAEQAVILSCASFLLVELGTPTVLVFVPHKYVQQLLGASDETWHNLCLLAQHAGRLSYKRTEKEPLQNLRMEQRVFSTYCRSVMVGRRMHMLCRQGKARSFPANPDYAPMLYCCGLRPITGSRSCLL